VLLIGAETLSRIVNYGDRTSCILFGDGAGAAVLSNEFERGEVLPSRVYSDGSGYDVMWIRTGGSAERPTPELMAAGHHFMRIRGRGGYKVAGRKFVGLVEERRKAE